MIDGAERTPSRRRCDHLPAAWQLLDTPPFGDCWPSVLMDSMLSLLQQDEPAGSLFLGIFLRRLPQDMRDHLSTRQFDTPHQMAETADLLWDARGHPQVTASGSAPALLMSTSLVAAAPAAPARQPSSPYLLSPPPSVYGRNIDF